MIRKPLIGITADYWSVTDTGETSQLGLPGQDWSYIARDYTKAIEAAGGIPVIIPIMEDCHSLDEILKRLEGLVLTGGKDIAPEFYGEQQKYPLSNIDPIRDEQEIELIKMIISGRHLPVFGICRGMQLINVAAGGTLYQDVGMQNPQAHPHSLRGYPRDYPTHSVTVKEDAWIASSLKGKTRVNSFHHQAVKEVAQDFKVSAISEDGIIEGMEYAGSRLIVAVQWHPEMMFESHLEQLGLFRKFIVECSKGAD